MTLPFQQMIFSPQNCRLEDLEAILTPDRRELTRSLIGRFEDGISKGAAHYALVVGPRGSGKTHVVTYVGKSLDGQSIGPQRLRVVRLSEEERGIDSLLHFLLACLRPLGVSPDEVREKAGSSDRADVTEAARRLFEETFKDHAILLCVENLSDLLAAFGNAGHRELRHFLQTHPQVSVLASAVELFSRSASPDHPFYGFFVIENLKPLSREDTKKYLIQLAGAYGKTDLAKALGEPASQAKINTIYDLTGGNHRLLSMLHGFLEAETVNDLVPPFVKLVDRELTPYYQQRLGRLSTQQNKILRCMAAQKGSALPVTQIARLAFVTQQVASKQLHDLLQTGLIRRTPVGRESYYEITEPLLRLALDMKDGRDGPLPVIVELLSQWYEGRELTVLAETVPAPAGIYYKAAFELQTELRKKDRAARRTKRAIHLFDKARAFIKARKYAAAFTLLDDIAKRAPRWPHPRFMQIMCLDDLGRRDEALRACDRFEEQFGIAADENAQTIVSHATILKGIWLGELCRYEEELAAYDQAIARLKGGRSPDSSEVTVQALSCKADTLHRLERYADMLKTCEEILQRSEGSKRVGRLKAVAAALANKTLALQGLGRLEEAVSVSNEIIAKFGSRPEKAIQEICGKTYMNIMAAYGTLGRDEDALRVAEDFEQQLTSGRKNGIARFHAGVLINKAASLAQLGRAEDAQRTYESVVSRFGKRSDVWSQEAAVRGLIGIAMIAAEMGKVEDTNRTLEDAIERFGGARSIGVEVQVEIALIRKAQLLWDRREHQRVVEVTADLIVRYGDRREPELQNWVAEAHVLGGVAFRELGRITEAGKSFESALRLRPFHVRGLTERMMLLLRSGRLEDAVREFTRLSHEQGLPEPARIILAATVIDAGIQNRSVFQAFKSTFESVEGKKVLSAGLFVWIRGNVPLQKSQAAQLAAVAQDLGDLLGKVTGGKLVMQLVEALHNNAEGDRTALMALPIEIRRLLETEGSKPDNSGEPNKIVDSAAR